MIEKVDSEQEDRTVAEDHGEQMHLSDSTDNSDPNIESTSGENDRDTEEDDEEEAGGGEDDEDDDEEDEEEEDDDDDGGGGGEDDEEEDDDDGGGEDDDEDEEEDDDGESRQSRFRSPFFTSTIGIIGLLGLGAAWLQLSHTPETIDTTTLTSPAVPFTLSASIPEPSAAIESLDEPNTDTEEAAIESLDEPNTGTEEKDSEDTSIDQEEPKTDQRLEEDQAPESASKQEGTSSADAGPQKPETIPLPEEDPVEMAMAPDPALIAESDFGPLPQIGEDGREPWQVYSRPYDADQKTPRIAILLAGLGHSDGATTTAIQLLPGGVTLGFVPYASRLAEWIELARAAGHEVVLELPMESFDYPSSDPGPHTLLTSLEPEKNIERLNFLLSRFTGYVGVTNFMGDKFTANADSLMPVLQELRDRGLLLLDARTSDSSVAGQIAIELKLPHATNNSFLDVRASRVAIDARLFELENIARANGSAVGIGFAYPVTIERIALWARTLSDKGINLAPVSAIASLSTSAARQ